jgi:hypothetical protein
VARLQTRGLRGTEICHHATKGSEIHRGLLEEEKGKCAVILTTGETAKVEGLKGRQKLNGSGVRFDAIPRIVGAEMANGSQGSHALMHEICQP